MKANELMIGDWVMFPNSIEKVQEISYVCGKGYCASFAASATLFPISIDKIEPIPLTTEILEKNEFEKWTWNGRRGRKITTYAIGEGFNLEEDDNGFDLVDNCSDSGDYGYESDYITDIKYVHELQHALKLCGIEKTIEL